METTLGWSKTRPTRRLATDEEPPVTTMPEESLWVARARTGDDAAFAALYARYERRIYAFVYRMMGNPDDAFDLTQETFLKAYRSLSKTDSQRLAAPHRLERLPGRAAPPPRAALAPLGGSQARPRVWEARG
jgi:hypothetical protein